MLYSLFDALLRATGEHRWLSAEYHDCVPHFHRTSIPPQHNIWLGDRDRIEISVRFRKRWWRVLRVYSGYLPR